MTVFKDLIQETLGNTPTATRGEAHTEQKTADPFIAGTGTDSSAFRSPSDDSASHIGSQDGDNDTNENHLSGSDDMEDGADNLTGTDDARPSNGSGLDMLQIYPNAEKDDINDLHLFQNEGIGTEHDDYEPDDVLSIESNVEAENTRHDKHTASDLSLLDITMPDSLPQPSQEHRKRRKLTRSAPEHDQLQDIDSDVASSISIASIDPRAMTDAQGDADVSRMMMSATAAPATVDTPESVTHRNTQDPGSPKSRKVLQGLLRGFTAKLLVSLEGNAAMADMQA